VFSERRLNAYERRFALSRRDKLEVITCTETVRKFLGMLPTKKEQIHKNDDVKTSTIYKHKSPTPKSGIQ